MGFRRRVGFTVTDIIVAGTCVSRLALRRRGVGRF
jgi:hypothetical protein